MPALLRFLEPGDVVTIKGSRGVHMEMPDGDVKLTHREWRSLQLWTRRYVDR